MSTSHPIQDAEERLLSVMGGGIVMRWGDGDKTASVRREDCESWRTSADSVCMIAAMLGALRASSRQLAEAHGVDDDAFWRSVIAMCEPGHRFDPSSASTWLRYRTKNPPGSA